MTQTRWGWGRRRAGGGRTWGPPWPRMAAKPRGLWLGGQHPQERGSGGSDESWGRNPRGVAAQPGTASHRAGGWWVPLSSKASVPGGHPEIQSCAPARGGCLAICSQDLRQRGANTTLSAQQTGG